jgi:hypothetical protein
VTIGNAHCSVTPAKDGNQPTLLVTTPVPEARLRELNSATELLAEVCEVGEFHTLKRRYLDLANAIATCEVGGNQPQAQASMEKVIDSFDSLLTSLRAFDDRTSHALSDRHGSQSAVLNDFKKSLSVEYDLNFAYRFCARLRNYGQHLGSPISGIRMNSKLAADGQIASGFEVYFDAASLLEKFNGWSTVKADLQHINGEFALPPIAESLMDSCTKIHCKLVLSREQEISDAVNLILEVAQEAATDGGSPGLALVSATYSGAAQLENFSASLRPIRFDLAIRAQAEVVLAKRMRQSEISKGNPW